MNSSLLSNASSWTPLTDDKPVGGKKKPTMYQTYQKITSTQDDDIRKFNSIAPTVSPFESQNSENQERVQRIETILQKMNQVQDHSTDLANFLPEPPLTVPKLSELSVTNGGGSGKEPFFNEPGSYSSGQGAFYGQDQTGSSYGQTGSSYGQTGSSYGQTGSSYGQTGSSYGQTGSSYQRVYNSPVPYFEPPIVESLQNSKLMEKLNYMIHLLEEQQHENTQYIVEEFLLYGLLGVFMIYLVDSFARAGKYIR